MIDLIHLAALSSSAIRITCTMNLRMVGTRVVQSHDQRH